MSETELTYNEKCNREVKLCQTCDFFQPTVFDYEEEYYDDEELGIFTLWVWKGICSCNLNPPEGLNFYHTTKSNKKCEYYITEKEAKELKERIGKDEMDVMVYVLTLKEIREANQIE